MKRVATAAAIAAVSIWAAGAASADPAAGREKAAMCQVCHGLDGIGKNPEVPHIAGESEIYLMAQLRAFRSGERQHQQMSIIAQSLSDEDIRDLADYYASIKFEVTVPDY
ncbi:cytochrome C554 [Acuticoccus sediminis]|uniref:Cytochrome C554 n=1 Tax=Acuticoccus sediminis TaxID=2184697 RepID=A0A8B2NZC5_9HYPH|nr:cytochrome c [Acuticoccus sediminis]RAI03236.1 cytochrome C554 [Acuticoccus sediminis]